MASPKKKPAGPTVARRRPAASPSAEVTPRVARRERRRERSREEILEAARRVLLANGLAATTLDAVAKEVGVSKTALYYYFASKDALLFELVYGTVRAQSQALHDAVAASASGGDALAAIVRETVRVFTPRLDDFRLAYLHGQVAGPSAVKVSREQLARLHPLNDLAFAGAARILSEERAKRPSRARVEPRLLAFIANLAAIGLLTMKGAAESIEDPLLYSDEQLIDAFARVFTAAAGP